ncbi:hypothetical protein ASPZODRAFT_148615 [Penicilliopsis zonata CBS 506.65]|uniref:Myb-like domain-containing protein n=1 Tax=Penicilliopsis zonata CBS 506.65 TaxID=1073090 RepID=A0A1L9SVV1_9EURO|nr:hypothetical protein ASPZODRAFT_148615 [Penicilliopsis zonata CBS 506.65]OJJ51309.1 hypothetical protein ASPZODRAFT_148615 [Penicilliopsis zonata CBS 506.65]
MSATLADPYPDYTPSYSHHANCTTEEQGNLLIFDASQTDLDHTHPSFTPDTPHQSLFDQHPPPDQRHAGTAILSSGTPQPMTHDYSQSVLLTSQLQPQDPLHYTPTALQVFSAPRGRKRSHAESEGEPGQLDPTVGPQLSGLPASEVSPEATHSPEFLFTVPGDSSPHLPPGSSHRYSTPQSSATLPRHHHHRLPPQASLQPDQQYGSDTSSPPAVPGPPSVVGQPGMPEPAPRPPGPKLKFTAEEDALLVELKENKNLTWRQISDFFPGRTSGTLQVRYCTKLKVKDTVWSDEMVERLRHAIEDYENDRWRIIATKVGHGFTPAACRAKAADL